MIEISDYFQANEKAEALSIKLHQRVFLKTAIDVVYSDVSNWERSGLLLIGGDTNKGEWKKLSYFEYVWVKMIEELRQYGFNYDEINLIKGSLHHVFTVKELQKAMADDVENLNKNISEIDIKNTINYLESLEPTQSIGLTNFEAMICNVIIKAEHFSLFFSKENPEIFIPFSIETNRGFEIIDAPDLVQNFLKKSFFSISLSGIISNFLREGDGSFEDRTTTIISKEEHKLINYVRKHYMNLKSVTIKYKDNKMAFIELKTTKKVKLESRLLEHIKKGDYKNISINTVDGEIVNFENTQIIKL